MNEKQWDTVLGSVPTDEDIGFDENDFPYCTCGNEPIEDEEASNQCFACGKPIC